MLAVDEYRHLVRPERAFVRQPIDELRPGPALRRSEHDHGPARPRGVVVLARVLLNRVNLADGFFQGRRHQPMHDLRVVALDEQRGPAATLEELLQFLVLDAGEDRRVADLEAVEMQDRQHRAVGDRIEKLVGLPGRRQRPGLGLAVADDAGDDQTGIVERRAEGVAEGIAEFAAFMDRAGRRGRDMARNAAGERKLLEQPLHSGFVLADVGIDLAVAAFEIGVGDQRRAAMAGTRRYRSCRDHGA